MIKKMLKIFGIFVLVIISFVYTNKVFKEAKANDPLMKQVVKYKEENDVKPKNAKIRDDEIILGISGLSVDVNTSYKNMKEEKKFDESKIKYNKVLPKNSIKENYDYYINSGNKKENKVSVIFKVAAEEDINKFLSVTKKYKEFTYFVDGKFLEENINYLSNIKNISLYNLGYDGKYDKKHISITNNMIESITLKDSVFCLNESKDDLNKKLCSSKKMYSIYPNIIEPDIPTLKSKLEKGSIILFDLSTIDESKIMLFNKIITARGYDIITLEKLISE